MSDIFLSYDDVDRERVRTLVGALEARGWSVWWDHRLAAGAAFSEVIARELEAARSVVVAWTRTSVESEWVRAEADEGLKRGKLVPVLLDRVDPPMPFGQIHAADLVGWDRPGHPGLAKLVSDLQARIGRDPLPVQERRPSFWFSRRKTALLVGSALPVSIALAYYVATAGPGSGLRPAEPDSGAAAIALSDSGEPLIRGGMQQTGEVSAAALSGHWQAPVTYPDGATFEERFSFEIAAGALSGTASLRGYGNRRGIQDGRVEGNRLTFRATGQVQTDLFSVREASYRYQGVLEGDSIRFSVVEEGTGDPPFTFTSQRISAEQANRIATGGRTPRLGGMSTEGLYEPDHIRAVLATGQRAMNDCYAAAEYDAVNHEFVSYDLTLDAAGGLERFEMRPAVASLESCMREVLAAREWGPTDTGAGGTLQLSLNARLPWNP